MFDFLTIVNLFCWIFIKIKNIFLLVRVRFLNDTEIAKAQRDFELKKAAYDVEVQSKVGVRI